MIFLSNKFFFFNSKLYIFLQSLQFTSCKLVVNNNLFREDNRCWLQKLRPFIKKCIFLEHCGVLWLMNLIILLLHSPHEIFDISKHVLSKFFGEFINFPQTVNVLCLKSTAWFSTPFDNISLWFYRVKAKSSLIWLTKAFECSDSGDGAERFSA